MPIAASPVRSICLVLTIALVAGCRGGTATAPMPPEPLGTAVRGAQSHVSPSLRSHDLLYLGDEENNTYVYSYPQLVREHTLAHLKPGGLCADTSGHVFIADIWNHVILEYAHGGKTPIASLADLGNDPADCAVDPRTGDLAVVNAGDSGISIYKQARGTPTIYTYPHALFGFSSCTYDVAGNLFADGFGRARGFGLLRLAYGSKAFARVTLDHKFHYGGAVRWDGKYLAITAIGLYPNPSVLYRFAISGTGGTTIGSARLLTSANVTNFAIEGANLIGIDDHGETGSTFKIWKYPHGGRPVASIGPFSQPIGTAVSKAQ